MITSDVIIFGILAGILGVLFLLRERGGVWNKVFTFVPIILLAYLIPSLLVSFGFMDVSESNLWPIAKDYFLTAALVLLTLSIDIKGIIGLGPKALIMFFTATVGIVIGGPIALWTVAQFAPEILGTGGSDAPWRGFATLAGSWIGGGANQAAMKEVFAVDDNLFGQFIAVDVLVANVWMAILLFLAGRAEAFDRWTGADTSAIDDMKRRIEAYQAEHARVLTLPELMMILAVGLGATGLAHALGGPLATWIGDTAPALARYSLTSGFFWIVVFATTLGLLMSFTRLRHLEGAGASKVGSGALYILVATIGMHMDLGALLDRPRLFALGFVWIAVHAALMLVVAKLIKAPLFFMAVGSQANIGGAASAPVVASAFHPSLAPVGVLMAVLGYALGTYCAYITGLLLQAMAGG